MIGMRVLPIRSDNDLRPRQPEDRRERSPRFKIRLQAAIRQAKIRSPIEAEDFCGRVGFRRSAFERPVRSRLARREVDDADSQTLLATHKDRPANTDLRIVRMRRDDEDIERLGEGSHVASFLIENDK